MPIVDGLTSTKMIRAFEQQQRQGTTTAAALLSPVAGPLGRIPVMAVSASLVERKKDTYVGAGFDAWILKPINFARLETLLRGLVDDAVRDEARYVPGEWECGGWFAARRASEGDGEGTPRAEKVGPAAEGGELGLPGIGTEMEGLELPGTGTEMEGAQPAATELAEGEGAQPEATGMTYMEGAQPTATGTTVMAGARRASTG
jgi:CheY-like chemotaxis protein